MRVRAVYLPLFIEFPHFALLGVGGRKRPDAPPIEHDAAGRLRRVLDAHTSNHAMVCFRHQLYRGVAERLDDRHVFDTEIPDVGEIARIICLAAIPVCSTDSNSRIPYHLRTIVDAIHHMDFAIHNAGTAGQS